MNRITKKEIESYNEFVISLGYEYCFGKVDDVMYRKLKSLEDIEEEFGMDLITLFDIYKQLNIKKEIWFKHENETDEDLRFINSRRYNGVYYLIDFKRKAFVETEYEPVHDFYFKDYGKTWALTREELENE